MILVPFLLPTWRFKCYGLIHSWIQLLEFNDVVTARRRDSSQQNGPLTSRFHSIYQHINLDCDLMGRCSICCSPSSAPSTTITSAGCPWPVSTTCPSSGPCKWHLVRVSFYALSSSCLHCFLRSVSSSLTPPNHLSRLFLSRLHSNNLQCDCHVAWLSEWLRQRPRLGLYTQCMAPPHLRGHNVAEVQKKEFVCTGRSGWDIWLFCLWLRPVLQQKSELCLTAFLYFFAFSYCLLLMLFKMWMKASVDVPAHVLA